MKRSVRYSRFLLCGAALLCFGHAGVSHAAGEDVFNVVDAVRSAIENHPAVEGAEAGYRAAIQGVMVEESAYYPEVSINTSFGRVYQDNSTSRGLVTERGAAYSGFGEGNIALRQTLFDGAERKSRVESADAKMQSMQYTLLDREAQVTLNAALSYVDVLRTSKAVSLLDKHIGSIRSYETRIQNMVKNGAADEAELQQAYDVVMILEGLRAEYKGQLKAARAGFYEAVGQPPPSRMLDPRSMNGLIVDDVEKVIEAVKISHPMLRSAKMDALAARHDIKAESSNLFPDVMGELSYLKSDKEDVIGGESRDARAVLRMNWNFSTGGAQFAAIRQRQQEQLEAKARRNELERQVERGVHQAYAYYGTMVEKLALSRKRVDLNEKLMDAYRAQFEGSRINLLSLMRAESQLFNARLEENDNRYAVLSSEYSLLSSLGELKNLLLSPPDSRTE